MLVEVVSLLHVLLVKVVLLELMLLLKIKDKTIQTKTRKKLSSNFANIGQPFKFNLESLSEREREPRFVQNFLCHFCERSEEPVGNSFISFLSPGRRNLCAFLTAQKELQIGFWDKELRIS